MTDFNQELKEMQVKALQCFAKEFSGDANICTYAPGRVNLIGEHTDYNEGFVLPMAVPLVTMFVGRANNTNVCRLFSMSDAVSSNNKAEIDVSDKTKIQKGEPKWANYIKGVFANFPSAIPGFDAVILSSVPAGGGLSSSAALEVSVYTFLEALTGVKSNPEDKVKVCQRAEHDFAGVPCGIMDQFISATAKENHALLLDCRDLTTKQISMANLGDYVFLIVNSNSPHKLGSSEYCKRRDCCIEAAKLLNKKSLREATLNDLEELKKKNASDVIIRRARHVISEIQRTVDAATALEKGDFVTFGKLMNQSHDSLRDDYDVSSEQLDTLVKCAREIDGVLGSRLTGAGFGGCTVTLLEKQAVDKVKEHIQKEYKGTPSFYIAKPVCGARQMQI